MRGITYKSAWKWFQDGKSPIPAGESIKPGFDSAIRNVQVCPPTDYPRSFSLESGEVDLMALVGITENDGKKLVELLARDGAFPITDPARKSVIPTLR